MTALAVWLVGCLALAALVNSIAALRETRRQAGRLNATLELLLEAVRVTDQTADKMVEVDRKVKWLEWVQGSRVEMHS